MCFMYLLWFLLLEKLLIVSKSGVFSVLFVMFVILGFFFNNELIMFFWLFFVVLCSVVFLFLFLYVSSFLSVLFLVLSFLFNLFVNFIIFVLMFFVFVLYFVVMWSVVLLFEFILKSKDLFVLSIFNVNFGELLNWVVMWSKVFLFGVNWVVLMSFFFIFSVLSLFFCMVLYKLGFIKIVFLFDSIWMEWFLLYFMKKKKKKNFLCWIVSEFSVFMGCFVELLKFVFMSMMSEEMCCMLFNLVFFKYYNLMKLLLLMNCGLGEKWDMKFKWS